MGHPLILYRKAYFSHRGLLKLPLSDTLASLTKSSENAVSSCREFEERKEFSILSILSEAFVKAPRAY